MLSMSQASAICRCFNALSRLLKAGWVGGPDSPRVCGTAGDCGVDSSVMCNRNTEDMGTECQLRERCQCIPGALLERSLAEMDALLVCPGKAANRAEQLCCSMVL